MIREKGSKAKTIHSKEEIKNIVKETHSFTINSLKHFCDLLGIDKKLLKHIYSTDVIIDYTDEINYESAVAFYKSNENKVHLLAEYVDEVLELQARDNNPVYVHNLSATILHELLHANRDIYIKGGTTEYDCLSSTKNLIQYENLSQKFGHLITGKFPIEALSYTKQHSQYMVSAYNNNTNSFIIYLMITNAHIEDIETINHIINSNALRKLYNCFKYNSVDYEYDNLTHSVTTYDYNSRKQLRNYTESNRLRSYMTIKKQNNMEEILIESLTHIILNASNRNELNLNNIYNFFIRNGVTEDVEIGIYTFKELGPEFIKWYMLSCYEEEYKDKFKDILKDNYYKFLRDMNKIYISYSTDVTYDQDNIQSIKRILKQTKNNK